MTTTQCSCVPTSNKMLFDISFQPTTRIATDPGVYGILSLINSMICFLIEQISIFFYVTSMLI